MKAFLYPLVVSFTGILAQDIDSLPACERTCIQDMLTQGPNYGCPNIANGSPAADCLCSKTEFAYGVRDCSTESCPSGTDISQVNQYGLQYCQSAQASASGTALAAIAVFSSGASPGGTSSSQSSGSSLSSREPISTIPVISTITTGGSTVESTLGSSTIYAGGTLSPAGGANATGSANTTGSAKETAVTTRPVVSTVSDSSTTRETTVGSTTVFSSAASSSSSAGAGATMAAPRLLPGFLGQPLDRESLWAGRALACTGFMVVAAQLAWAYGGW